MQRLVLIILALGLFACDTSIDSVLEETVALETTPTVDVTREPTVYSLRFTRRVTFGYLDSVYLASQGAQCVRSDASDTLPTLRVGVVYKMRYHLLAGTGPEGAPLLRCLSFTEVVAKNP